MDFVKKPKKKKPKMMKGKTAMAKPVGLMPDDKPPKKHKLKFGN